MEVLTEMHRKRVSSVRSEICEEVSRKEVWEPNLDLEQVRISYESL